MMKRAALLVATVQLFTLGACSVPFHRYASGVNSVLTYLLYTDTTAFGYWTQLAGKTILPMFKENRHNEMTAIIPVNSAFDDFMASYGVSASDPQTASTAEWQDRWADTFEYFWVDGLLDTTAVGAGETVILESKKKSPAGDWQLPMVFRRDDILLSGNDTYNGTISSYPYGEGNITTPDLPVTGFELIMAQSVNFMPVQPQSLTITLSQAGFADWATITYRVPSLLALETSYNFTLLLPPTDILNAALDLTDSALATFINAHIIQDERLVLQPTTQTSTSGLSYQNAWIATTTGYNATVLVRNVATNGGLVQLIDRQLAALTNTTTVSKRDEL